MRKYLALMVAVACIAACKGPPIQEMSDARQAISAARAAGAAQTAPQDLEAAQAAIARAENDLHQEHFTRARMAAKEAKRRAAAALVSSQGKSAGSANSN